MWIWMKKAAQVKKQLLESDTLSWLKAMKQMGLSREETMEMAERMWEEER